MTMRATVYESGGRWVADCPAGCGNAWAPTIGDAEMRCYLAPVRLPSGAMTRAIGCGAVFAVDWVGDPADLHAGQRRRLESAARAHQAYLAEAAREHAAQHTPDVPDGQ